MPRPLTLFTGQWTDLPLEEVVEKAAGWGYDGLELACWGGHLDVHRAAEDTGWCEDRRSLLSGHGLSCHAISNHLVGQAVCDPIDDRHRAILPEHVWGDGDPEGVRRRAADEMILTAKAAANLGVDVVNGFTGSATWHAFYFFPPTPAEVIEDGFADFARRWGPILDAYRDAGIRFALEVHPTEIAYDVHTAQRALEAVDHHESFGFNFDPSHLVWQGVDPVRFIERFPDRIYHVHMKDTALNMDGTAGLLGSHLPFGDARRAWDFRSVGRGDIDFESIIRALNRNGYEGPLSVEWEDEGMDREHGAAESCRVVRELDFTPGERAFDESFQRS